MLPMATTGAEMYLAAVLEALQRIEKKLDALQPPDVKPDADAEEVELTEPAKQPKKGRR